MGRLVDMTHTLSKENEGDHSTAQTTVPQAQPSGRVTKHPLKGTSIELGKEKRMP